MSKVANDNGAAGPTKGWGRWLRLLICVASFGFVYPHANHEFIAEEDIAKSAEPDDRTKA
jgi:hypothetical protein